ncbi:MAG: hypothetical protein R3C53_02025 [Pirellulaceae bacterium]
MNSARSMTLLIVLLLPTVGCNSFGNAKLVQQLQNENERLLTEFRAERQRREESEKLNSTLEARLSESEKLLARQTLGATPNRLSSLPAPGGSPGVSGIGFSGNGGGAGTASSPAALPSTTNSGASNEANDMLWQRRVN